MPNWSFGYVNVTGTRDGIKSFIERFVSEDDPSTIPGKRFFARSFIQSKRQAFIDEAMKNSPSLPSMPKQVTRLSRRSHGQHTVA